MKRSVLLMLACCLLCSCRGNEDKKSEARPQPKPKAEPKAEPKAKAQPKADVREVATAAELLDAIGSDRTLRLKAGTYVLSEVPDKFMEHVVWKTVFDGKSITIKGVKRLTIIGPKDRSAKLLVRPQYAFVLEFKNCEKLRLENLVLGHAPKKGGCQRGVLGFKNVRGANVTNCDLFGCGTEGLTLADVSDFVFSKSKIRDCSYGIMTLKDCKRLSFADSQFTGNREHWGVQVQHCDGVSFKRCSFTKNTVDGPLFAISSSNPVRLLDTSIEGNSVKRLVDNPKALKVVKTAK
jgi:Right handed beta helix region